MAKFNGKTQPSYDISSIVCNGDDKKKSVNINVKGKKNKTI